jgi:hypothetical protein
VVPSPQAGNPVRDHSVTCSPIVLNRHRLVSVLSHPAVYPSPHTPVPSVFFLTGVKAPADSMMVGRRRWRLQRNSCSRIREGAGREGGSPYYLHASSSPRWLSAAASGLFMGSLDRQRQRLADTRNDFSSSSHPLLRSALPCSALLVSTPLSSPSCTLPSGCDP